MAIAQNYLAAYSISATFGINNSDIIQCLQCNGTSCYCGACGGKGTIFKSNRRI